MLHIVLSLTTIFRDTLPPLLSRNYLLFTACFVIFANFNIPISSIPPDGLLAFANRLYLWR
jgi:hypothetical protein